MGSSTGGKKFAVLLCAKDSKYVVKKCGGYLGVFVRMLAEEGETWDVYRVASGDFPTDEEIESYDGFVITGSCNDAHGNDDWIISLLVLIRKLDSMNKKILGICFGHQILGRAMGGKTQRNTKGWDIGIRNVHLSSSWKRIPSLEMPSMLPIIECHRDEIWELPAKAEVMAWSDKTGIEMFRCGDNIMGIQGHPEYNKAILRHLIDRLISGNYIVESFGEEVRANLDGKEPNKEAWKKLCTNFLKSRI